MIDSPNIYPDLDAAGFKSISVFYIFVLFTSHPRIFGIYARIRTKFVLPYTYDY